MERTAVSGEAWEADEAALIARARTDSVAFAALYQRHLHRVFRYLLTYTESIDDASDLTQVVFLRALEALPRYRQGGTPFIAWLFRIARNAALDTYRRNRRTLPWDHLPAEWVPFSASDPEEESVRRESLNRLRVLVSQLPAQKQELLYLRFAGELTAAEIGLVVGKSEGAVQKQLQRIVRDLREGYRASEE